MNEEEKAIRLSAVREICKSEGHNPGSDNLATYGDWPMNIFQCQRGCGTVLLTLSDTDATLADVAGYLEGYAGTDMNFTITSLGIQVSPKWPYS